jgi:hypothetical protein
MEIRRGCRALLTSPLVECHHTKPFDFDVTLMPLIEKFCHAPDWLHGIRPAPD